MLCRTKIYSSASCVVIAGDVSRAEQCRTWKFITKSFAVNPATIPSRTSSPFALSATPLRITAKDATKDQGQPTGPNQVQDAQRLHHVALLTAV
jgi:hypothetical protein